MESSGGKIFALWFLVIVLAALVGGMLILRWANREESYIGELRSGGKEEQKAAAEKLGEMGSIKALPHILRRIRIRDRSLEPNTKATLRQNPGLGMFSVSKDHAVFLDAAWRITEVNGKAAVGSLLETLRSSDRNVAIISAFLLGELGRKAEDARTALEGVAQRSRDGLLLHTATQAAWKIQGKAPRLTPRLWRTARNGN